MCSYLVQRVCVSQISRCTEASWGALLFRSTSAQKHWFILSACLLRLVQSGTAATVEKWKTLKKTERCDVREATPAFLQSKESSSRKGEQTSLLCGNVFFCFYYCLFVFSLLTFSITFNHQIFLPPLWTFWDLLQLRNWHRLVWDEICFHLFIQHPYTPVET